METKRKAVLLLLMLCLDNMLGYPQADWITGNRSNQLPTEPDIWRQYHHDSENIPERAPVKLRVERDLVADDVEDDDDEEDDPDLTYEDLIEGLEDLEGTGEGHSVLYELLSSVLDLLELHAADHIHCNDPAIEAGMPDLDEMIMSRELSELALVLIYAAAGCRARCITAMGKLETQLGWSGLTEVIVDFIFGLADDDEGSPTTSQSLDATMEQLLAYLDILDAMEPARVPPLPICTWTNDSVSDCYTLGEEMQYSSNLEAKTACERIGECIGVTIDPRTSSWVLTGYCEDAISDSEDMMFVLLKNCSNIEATPGSSRQNERKQLVENAHVTAYQYRNYNNYYYSGERQQFKGMVANVGPRWQSRISSLSCSGTCTMFLFEEENFGGRQIAFTNRVSDLGSYDFDNRITSLIVVPYAHSKLCYTLYTRPHFSGRSRRFCGDVSLRNLEWNNRVGSIRLHCQSCSVIAYDGMYIGHYKGFNSDVSTVTGLLRNTISSIQVRPWQYPSYEGHHPEPVTFYTDYDYRGRSRTFKREISFDVRGDLNNEFSSFRCDGSFCDLLVFEDFGMGGDSRLYRGSQSRLRDFNDKISSFIKLPNEICVRVYTHPYFRGDSVRFCHDVARLRTFNDQISSFKIECTGKCYVTLFEHHDFGGKFKHYSGNVARLDSSRDNQATSLQIRPGHRTGEGCRQSPREARAYSIIQWIPVISSIYSLSTVPYYNKKGCSAIAKQRSNDFLIDLGMDAAMAVVTVLTAGAAGPAAYGFKTSMKYGFKAGSKAFGKAIAAAVKSSLKSTAKLGLKGLAKKIGKEAIGGLTSVFKLLKKTPTFAKMGVRSMKKGFGKLATLNTKKFRWTTMGKSIKTGMKNAIDSAKHKLDDLAGKAQKKIDDLTITGKKTNGLAGSAPASTRDEVRQVASEAIQTGMESAIRSAKHGADDLAQNAPRGSDILWNYL